MLDPEKIAKKCEMICAKKMRSNKAAPKIRRLTVPSFHFIPSLPTSDGNEHGTNENISHTTFRGLLNPAEQQQLRNQSSVLHDAR